MTCDEIKVWNGRHPVDPVSANLATAKVHRRRIMISVHMDGMRFKQAFHTGASFLPKQSRHPRGKGKRDVKLCSIALRIHLRCKVISKTIRSASKDARASSKMRSCASPTFFFFQALKKKFSVSASSGPKFKKGTRLKDAARGQWFARLASLAPSSCPWARLPRWSKSCCT